MASAARASAFARRASSFATSCGSMLSSRGSGQQSPGDQSYFRGAERVKTHRGPRMFCLLLLYISDWLTSLLLSLLSSIVSRQEYSRRKRNAQRKASPRPAYIRLQPSYTCGLLEAELRRNVAGTARRVPRLLDAHPQRTHRVDGSGTHPPPPASERTSIAHLELPEDLAHERLLVGAAARVRPHSSPVQSAPTRGVTTGAASACVQQHARQDRPLTHARLCQR